jgi:hypothetical protein
VPLSALNRVEDILDAEPPVSTWHGQPRRGSGRAAGASPHPSSLDRACSEDLFEPALYPEELKQTDRAIELDQEVHVAVGPGLVAYN